eukprot:XP_014048387.1 PREDICTED: keratin, type I cytoskeletal 13-like [Salmo salar]
MVGLEEAEEHLGTYLERVATQGEANTKPELQFRERGLSHVKIDSRDISTHRRVPLQGLRVSLTCASLWRLTSWGLKRMLGVMSLARSDLEMQLEDLKEEVVYLKKNHKKKTMWFRDPMSGQVQVEVDAALAQDLYTVITEIREQYQGLVSKSRRETGAWFKNKVEVVQQEVSSSTEVLQTTSVELKSGQSTARDLELELQCPLSVKALRRGTLRRWKLATEL